MGAGQTRVRPLNWCSDQSPPRIEVAVVLKDERECQRERIRELLSAYPDWKWLHRECSMRLANHELAKTVHLPNDGDLSHLSAERMELEIVEMLFRDSALHVPPSPAALSQKVPAPSNNNNKHKRPALKGVFSNMSFQVSPLPYAKESLEPHISRETLEFHYEKHHKGYAAKLNALTAGTPQATKTLQELIQTSTGPVFNNAAQVFNHTFYWESMKPGGSAPDHSVTEFLTKAFGSVEAFKAKFTERAVGHFGSGWVWLVVNKEGAGEIWEGHDAGCPLSVGLRPLMTLDVWEHAYYVDKRNNRAEYVKSWWNVVNWEHVSKCLAQK